MFKIFEEVGEESEKTIIFDLDGTLWDSTKQIKTVWSKISKKYSLTIDSNEINKIM